MLAMRDEAQMEDETDAGPGTGSGALSRFCIATRTVKPVGELLLRKALRLAPFAQIVPHGLRWADSCNHFLIVVAN